MEKLAITPDAMLIRSLPSLDTLVAGLLHAVLEPKTYRNRSAGGRPFNRTSPTTRNNYTNCNNCMPCSRPWFSVVKIGRYSPNEVRVKTEDDLVIINARHEESSQDGTDFFVSESRRTVTLPKTIDKAKVLCFFHTDGRVLVQAPYLNATKTQEKTETAGPSEEKQLVETTINEKFDQISRDGTTVKADTCAPSNDYEPREGEGLIPLAKDRRASLTVSTELQAHTDATNLLTNDETSTDSGNTAELSAETTNTGDRPIIEEPHEVDKIVRHTSPVPSEDDFTILESPFMEDNGSVEKKAEDMTVYEKEPNPSFAEDESQELKPLSDKTCIRADGDGEVFEVKLNLTGFDSDDVSVRFVDDDLFIDAKRELRDSGVQTLQEVHRKYTVPETGILDAARALFNDEGLVIVSVPLKPKPEAEEKTLPIVQHVE